MNNQTFEAKLEELEASMRQHDAPRDELYAKMGTAKRRLAAAEEFFANGVQEGKSDEELDGLVATIGRYEKELVLLRKQHDALPTARDALQSDPELMRQAINARDALKDKFWRKHSKMLAIKEQVLPELKKKYLDALEEIDRHNKEAFEIAKQFVNYQRRYIPEEKHITPPMLNRGAWMWDQFRIEDAEYSKVLSGFPDWAYIHQLHYGGS